MTALTSQQQAIETANNLISSARQLMELYLQMTMIDQQWTDWGVSNTLAAMGTVVQNVDGSLGAADGSPNVAHPLNPATYPVLTVALSSNQIAQLKTILDGLVNYVGGSAVTTQAGARAILNAANG